MKTENFALEIHKLKKVYPALGRNVGTAALNGLSLAVHSGEIFGLLGPNGAGKTSLISIITTLEEATEGEVKVFGHNVATDSAFSKPLLGYVGQEIITSGFFDVDEILNFHSGYYGIANNKERIEYLLEKLGLKEHRRKKVKQLSGGMKRRLMIAKALVHSPRLLLLDEPTAGVDIELRESLWDFVLELKKQGVTILLTTHYLQEAEALCDRVGIILKGEIKSLGPTQELIRGLSKREIQVTVNSNRVISHPDLAEQGNGKLKFICPASAQVGGVLSQAGIRSEEILDIVVKEGGLEEAMKQILATERKP